MCPQEQKGYAVTTMSVINKKSNSIKRYGVALMFLRAYGRKSMPVCLETLLFLCSYVLLFSALAADFTIHEQRNATFSPHRHMFIVIR